MKNYLSAAIIGLSIILSVAIASNAFVNRNKTNDEIAVKGLSSRDFTSDLIVWKASFSRQASTLEQAYKLITQDRKEVENYLQENGIKKDEIVFNAVTAHKLYDSYYDENDHYRKIFKGYNLTQEFKIKSKEVEKVENLSREITELIDKGVYLNSQSPKYYYTKLDELKIEMIAEATENARLRAEQIASNSGAKLGKLKSAQLGVFQITGQYSDEEYSWGGTFNTSSKEKTATVTVRAKFAIK